MADLVQVTDFSPIKIASGESISVDLLYTADDAGFVVVNEAANFDAVPGKIPIKGGVDLKKTVSLRITRQPNASNKECAVMFTLGAASFTILVSIK
jgi:hypothetical protein